LADRFIFFGVAPIDYDPVLLRKPFGFHLTMDTLPSGELQRKVVLLSPASEALPPLLNTTLLIRASEGLQPS
jgi:hypothetical protein